MVTLLWGKWEENGTIAHNSHKVYHEPLENPGDTIPQPPPIPKTLFEPMWLDTKLETITRLQTKPGHMYTFVCAQEFRRDEFAAHSKGMRNSIKYYFEIYNDITIYYT